LTKVGAGAAALGLATAKQRVAFAEDDEQPATTTEEPTTTGTTTEKPRFQEYTGVRELKKDYKAAALLLIANMKAATELNRGDPDVEKVKMFRTQMTDFFSQYRRFDKIKGTPSFTTLYDCINILAGHYASYGEKYPIPEKRRVRLRQLYKEAERALARGK
jgi:photosystem II Psb27 protein